MKQMIFDCLNKMAVDKESIDETNNDSEKDKMLEWYSKQKFQILKKK